VQCRVPGPSALNCRASLGTFLTENNLFRLTQVGTIPRVIPILRVAHRLPALTGKNAGPTGMVLMIDVNQVLDVQQAIDYMSSLGDQALVRAHRGVFSSH
jgi:hypothetical protein